MMRGGVWTCSFSILLGNKQVWVNARRVKRSFNLEKMAKTQFAAPKFFFPWILPLLVVRHCSKLSSYQPNLRKWQKIPIFGSDFGLFWPKFGSHNFFFVGLTSTRCYCCYCMQCQGILMNQTWENDQKPSFEPDFGPNLGPQNFFHRFYLN